MNRITSVLVIVAFVLLAVCGFFYKEIQQLKRENDFFRVKAKAAKVYFSIFYKKGSISYRNGKLLSDIIEAEELGGNEEMIIKRIKVEEYPALLLEEE